MILPMASRNSGLEKVCQESGEMKKGERKKWLPLVPAVVLLTLTGFGPGNRCLGAGTAGVLPRTMTLVKGQSARLTLNGAAKGKNVKWRSSRKKVASVKKNGTVKALKNGKTVISASAGKKLYSCLITVENPVLNRKKLELPEGGRFRLRLMHNTQTITWKSRDPKTASVSRKGLVRARKAGCTKILATTASGKIFACRLIVKEALKKEAVNAETLIEETCKEETLKAEPTGALQPDKPPEAEETEAWKSLYSYHLEVLNNPKYHLYAYTDSGGCRIPCEVVMFLKTDNPDRASLLVETGVGDEAGMGLPDYADIRGLGPLNTYLTQAEGGYVIVRGYCTAGPKTVAVCENDQGIFRKTAEISFEVLDGDGPFREWREAVIRQAITPGMTNLEKAEAIREYIRTKFMYLRGTAGYPVFFTFDVGAGWESRLIDCGGAADYMTFFMRDLQIENQIISYTTQAGNEHSVNRIFYEGEWYLIDAQPPKRTGVSDFEWTYVN